MGSLKLKQINWISYVVLLPISLFLLFSVDVYAAEKRIPAGITIGDIDAGGMTEEELMNRANEVVASYTGKTVALDVDGNEVDVTAGDLGYYWKNKGIVNEAASYCTEGNVIQRYKYEKDVAKKGIHYDFEMDVDDEVMESTLRQRCSVYNVPHVDATMTRNGDHFDITPEAKGKRVDIESGVKEIHDALMEQKYDESPKQQVLKVVDDLPTCTSAACAQVKDMIGTFSTTFSMGSANYGRNKNLENGINKLNGITMGVGDTISVNSFLEPWTSSNGWQQGGTFVNGRVENSLGGGICQVSTTLYNAALNAEIEVVERYCHSMTVGYVPVSMDAALAGTWKDLKLRNNTNTPIYIEGVYEAGRITFNIYGVETRPDNRSVQYSSKRVSSGASSYKCQLVKRVYLDGVLQEESVVNSSTYKNGGGYTGSRMAVTKPGQEQPMETVQFSEEITSETPSESETQPIVSTPAPTTTVRETVPAVQTPAAKETTTKKQQPTTSYQYPTTPKQTTTKQKPTQPVTQPTTQPPTDTPTEPETPTESDTPVQDEYGE